MPAPSKGEHVLAKLRQVLNLGQKELAELAQCSASSIQRIELGKLPLSESLAQRISDATGVGLHWLLASDLTKPIVDWGEEPYTKQSFELFRAQPHPTSSLDLDDFHKWAEGKSFGLAGEPLPEGVDSALLAKRPMTGPIKLTIRRGDKKVKLPKRFKPDAVVNYFRTKQEDYYARRTALRLLEKMAVLIGCILGHKDRVIILHRLDQSLKLLEQKHGLNIPVELTPEQIENLIMWLDSLLQIRSGSLSFFPEAKGGQKAEPPRPEVRRVKKPH